MILDQTIGSARAEAHCDHAGRRLVGNLLSATLALVLVLASLTNLAALEGLSRQSTRSSRNTLPLPRIRLLDSMPWMNWNVPAPTLRIDTLMLPGVPPRVAPETAQVGTEVSRTLA